MKFGVVVFPGSNCDEDCYYALEKEIDVPVEYLWHKTRQIKGFDAIVLPGGFSYGDYLRVGAIARFSPIMSEIVEFAKKGGLVIGICNGFQILLEAGLLPGAMLRNKNLKFICKYVFLKTENNNTPFTNEINSEEMLKIPIAHGEGNYYIEKEGLEKLKENGQIIFRYCDENGNVDEDSNPNGSVYNIAGICNDKKNVLGMMPHPERCCNPIFGSVSGRKIFQSMKKFIEQKI